MAVEADPPSDRPADAPEAAVPYEAASAGIFPYLGSRTEAVRRQAMSALELLAGGSFLEQLQGFLSHPDPAVVHAALDHLRRNPSERACPGSPRDLRGRGLRRSARRPFPSSRRRPRRASPMSRCGARRRRRGHPLPGDRAPLQVPGRVADRGRCCATVATTRAGCGRGDRRARTRSWRSPRSLDRGGPPPALRLERQGAPARLPKIIATQAPAPIADAFLRTFRDDLRPGQATARSSPSESSGPSSCERFSTGTTAAISAQGSRAGRGRSPSRSAPPRSSRTASGSCRRDWWLRDRAAMALAEIRDESALPHLLKMLQDPESNLSAAAALGAWGTPQGAARPCSTPTSRRTASRTCASRSSTRSPTSRIRKVGPLLQKIVQVDPEPAGQGQGRAPRAPARRRGDVVGPASARVFEPFDFASHRDALAFRPAPSRAGGHARLGPAPGDGHDAAASASSGA